MTLHNCPGTTTSRCWRSSTPLNWGNGTQRRRWRAAGPPLSPTSWPDELTSSLPSIDEIEAELATTLKHGAYQSSPVGKLRGKLLTSLSAARK